MLGGLLTLAGLAFADTVFSRSYSSFQNLLFMLITSAGCVLITGLPEALFPDIPEKPVMLFKITLGPLGGAIALHYLGLWLGGMREDVLVHRITAWGGATLFAATVSLALVALLNLDTLKQNFHDLLLIAAMVNMAAVVLALFATIRATLLGDPLAHWMTLSCFALAGTVAGLYLRGLNVPGFGLGTWMATVAFTLSYYISVSILIIVRTRQLRQLSRLSRLQFGADPSTNLHTGSVLLAEVEHAFWRTARLQSKSTVVCLNLNNLYQLGEVAGHGVEHQILVATAARIRRAVGFRCVVGMYHQRCFVVVISEKKHKVLTATVNNLRALVSKPLSVVGANDSRHGFTPHLGVGMITIDPGKVSPMDALNEAERLALEAIPAPDDDDGPVTEDEIDTTW